MLELRNITKAYKTKSGDVKALNNLSVTFPSTGLVFITGKSGCGKTTLLNVIGGLDDYDSGEILLLGKSFKDFTSGDLNDYRNTFIGFIFQEYNLLTEFTAEKNIEIAMELQGTKSDPEEVDALLKKVEIDGLRKRKPMELSGGQRQRLAIARALVKNPRIIMADEPTGALDSNTGIQVIETLKKLSKDKLIIVVSHDQEFAEKYADRIIRLVDGTIAEDVTYNDSVLESNVSLSNDKIYVKQGSDLTQNELTTLAQAIKSNKKIELINSDSYRDKSQTEQDKIDKAEGEFEMTKSKMKLKSSLAMGVKSLGVKPLRLIFTILLSVVAFAVFGLFDTIANFTTEGVIANLIKQSDSTISLFSTYTPDEQNSLDNYQIKISESRIEQLQSEFGTKVKGVYNYKMNSTGKNIDYNIVITEVSNNSGNVINGAHYYTTSFNGFVEFDKSKEISGRNFNDFDYTIVKGDYPTLNPDGTPKNEIAISTYIADSIIHYLRGVNPVLYSNYDTIVGNRITLTIENVAYKVVGIIDCGKIDKKYDELKDLAYPGNSATRQLKADFDTYISSGPQKCIFVATGSLDYNNKVQSNVNKYYTGSADWVIKYPDSRFTNRQITSAKEMMLASKEYSSSNIIFFDQSRTNYKLADDEIIIHPQNLAPLLYNQSSTFTSKYKNTLNDYLDDLSQLGLTRNEYVQIYNNLFNTKYQKNGSQEPNYTLQFDTKITLKVSKNSSKNIEKSLKVVGVYFDVNIGTMNTTSPYVFMMNDNLLNEYEICTEQGDYSRILIKPAGKTSVTNTIASYMSKTEGYKLVWFKNTALEQVQANEATVRQFSELFLYVALVLAFFSIFMLFNYIATSIINKRHSTGILRALGANGKDILSMFLIESIIIALINGVLAVGLSAVGCALVNSYIANIMNIAIPFALFGLRQVIIILGISVLTAILSSTIPIIRIVKEKPVNLIRRS